MNDSSPSMYAFGPFVIDSGRRLLLCDGQQVSLSPKVLDTLLTLVENRDRVVTKDELLRAVWGDTVVEEGGLARNVSLLRKALGETPDDHQYVVTLPGRGYQFVAEVRPLDESNDALVLAAPPQVTTVAPAATDPPGRRVLGPRWLTLGAIAALTLGIVAYAFRPEETESGARLPVRSIAVLPLENLSGDPTQEYFVDGITESLIGNLARVRTLRVVSRTSVMRFKGTRPAVKDIARTLAVTRSSRAPFSAPTAA